MKRLTVTFGAECKKETEFKSTYQDAGYTDRLGPSGRCVEILQN
jgi:hypothetical protein